MYSMTVYTQTSCGPCVDFKKALEQNNINYTNKDVEVDLEARKEFLDKGFNFTPTTVIEIDGDTQTLFGADIGKVLALLPTPTTK